MHAFTQSRLRKQLRHFAAGEFGLGRLLRLFDAHADRVQSGQEPHPPRPPTGGAWSIRTGKGHPLLHLHTVCGHPFIVNSNSHTPAKAPVR